MMLQYFLMEMVTIRVKQALFLQKYQILDELHVKQISLLIPDFLQVNCTWNNSNLGRQNFTKMQFLEDFEKAELQQVRFTYKKSGTEHYVFLNWDSGTFHVQKSWFLCDSNHFRQKIMTPHLFYLSCSIQMKTSTTCNFHTGVLRNFTRIFTVFQKRYCRKI